MNIKLISFFFLTSIGSCFLPSKQSGVEAEFKGISECSFDSTCQGCQNLGIPFDRHWASQFSDLNSLSPYIIHISFQENYFEIVNNKLIEYEILIQRGRKPHYASFGIGIMPTVIETKWSDSTFMMIAQYFPFPDVCLEEPHPNDIGYLKKDIAAEILKKKKILEYHFFQLKSDTLIQYYFADEIKYSNFLPLDSWLPQAMKISHPILKPDNKNLRKNYFIEYLGNKCMCKSALVKVFNKNPIKIHDSPDSFY